MNEEFLQYIWEHNLFKDECLRSVKNDDVEIESVGRLNRDAGPDFFDARIKINETLWAGNVEIHIKSSDWNRHNTDPAYNNVVLHVVQKFDGVVKNSEGREIPCIELDYPAELLEKYEILVANQNWIHCEEEISKIDKFFVNTWLNRVLVERLERKSKAIQTTLNSNKIFWEETFYQYLARYFGMKVNADPFEQLAKSLPMRCLARQKDSLLHLEALLFGQAGFLERSFPEDEYFTKLKREYQFLRKKYDLTPLNLSQWKFLRLRPYNFPTIRIAQFASLVYQSQSLFSRVLETADLEELRKLLQVKTSEYWNTHYVFNKKSVGKKKVLGEAALNNLLINTIVPFLFTYGKAKNDYSYCDRALDFLDKIKPEQNAIINKWKTLGVETRSAYFTQSLIQLKETYCDNHRCIECELGNRIVRAAFVDSKQ